MQKKKRQDGSSEKGRPRVRRRDFPEPDVLTITEEAFNRPGIRIGFLSRIDFKSAGYRRGLVRRAFEIFAEEGCVFNVLNGGMVSKKYVKDRLSRAAHGVRKEFKDEAINVVLYTIAQELKWAIPRIRKPGDDNAYVRLYAMSSLTYDGTWGDVILSYLQAFRDSDIRHEKQGGHRLIVKGIDEFIWPINPKKPRLPSQYYSQAAEKEIKDKEGQTSQPDPGMWIVGTHASSVHKPRGEKKTPYITLPALHRLEDVTVAENQVGVRVLEYTDEGIRLVRTYDFKDLVGKERTYITGIKRGANETHEKIVACVKEYGAAATEGIIADRTELDRKTIRDEIKFLVEPKSSSRTTWPGLYYDPSSQRYDFHLNWLQDRLMYPAYTQEVCEDRMLFFGCLHAGYTTTDYEYVVMRFPEIMLRHDITHLFGLGDFIAGLKHRFLERGEIVGGLNYTEQERFAAELVGTVMIRVFGARLEEFIKELKGRMPAMDEVVSFVENNLTTFVYIAGNHDEWQRDFGAEPLAIFRDKLILLLNKYIAALLGRAHFPIPGTLMDVVEKKIVAPAGSHSIYTLPSKLLVEMFHPHMARAKTSSLRAQEMLDASDAHIVGGANFHTAIEVERWEFNLGERVVGQVATMVIDTDFEAHKLKRLDFGPLYLRVRSHGARIMMAESGFYTERMLNAPARKSIDVEELKKKLGILIIE